MLTLAIGVDSNLPDNFGGSVAYLLSASTTFVTITYIGGLPFLLAAVIFGTLYYSSQLLCGTSTEQMC